MLALRHQIKSRGRSKSRGQVKRCNSNELLGVPAVITICNYNNESEEGPQGQNPKKEKSNIRSRSRKRSSTSRNVSDEDLKQSDITRAAGFSERKTEIQSKRLHLQKPRKSSSDANPFFKETRIQDEQTDTLDHLRLQLMNECMGAIERRQKQAREQLTISVDEERSRKNFDNLLKQSIKQHVTKASNPKNKCKEFTSNATDPLSEKHETERKEKRSKSKNHKKLRSSTASSERKSSDIALRTSSPQDCEHKYYQKVNTKKPTTRSNRNNSVTKNVNSTKSEKPNSLNSTSSTSSSNLSSKSGQNLERQQKEKKRSMKQNSARNQTPNTKRIELKANSSPSSLEEYGIERKNTKSNSENEKKLSTTELTVISDEISNSCTLELVPLQSCKQNDLEIHDSESIPLDTNSGWRKTVSNMIAAGRSRSKSLSRSKSRLRPLRKTISWPKSSSQSSKRSNDRKNISQRVDNAEASGRSDNSTSIEGENDMKWHHAILRHDWDHVRTMLKSYDYTKFRQLTTSMGNRCSPQDHQEISPLLQIDAQGWTPLHLACKEHMPSRLLRRLLFVERRAASIQDNDGRYPLHLVAINSLDQHVLDRVIHASPDILGAPDYLNHTPIQYAVLKADRSRDKKEVVWAPAKSKEQAEIQSLLIDAYQPVLFILKSMVKRRKVLSMLHESRVLSEAVKIFAPPEIVDLMVILSEKILQKDQEMSENLVEMVFHLNYPLNVIHRVLETTSKIIPEVELLATVRQKLTDHFCAGCANFAIKESRGKKATTSLAKEFSKSCQRGTHKEGKPSPACKDWWDKLRYLVARSCNRTSNWKNDTVLHMALCNPKSQPSMIEYLCRLNPGARYKRDCVTDALPIHLACMHWHPEKFQIGSTSSHIKILNILLAGDFDLARRTCNGRTALHYAVLNGKPSSYIQSLINLNEETTSIYDPVTKLLPFQLAAISEKCDDREPTQLLDVIYGLLRANPSVFSTLENSTRT